MSAKQKREKQAKVPKDQGQARVIKGADIQSIRATAILAIQAQQVIGLAKGVKEGATSISQQLLTAAKTFPNLASFKAECSRQEAWLKSEDGIAMVNQTHPELNYHGGKTPACWQQAKSNIVKTWTHEGDIAKHQEGFTLKACNTESEMRKALNGWRKIKDAKPSMLALERLGNVVRSLERAKAEGSQPAVKAVTDATNDVLALFENYNAILAKVLPKKPVKEEVKKAA